MNKVEYRVFNLKSDTDKYNEALKSEGGKFNKLTWLNALNILGNEGWKFVHAVTEHTFLLMRDIK